MISKTDFIERIEKFVIPRIKALLEKQKTPISQYVGVAVGILVLIIFAFISVGGLIISLICVAKGINISDVIIPIIVSVSFLCIVVFAIYKLFQVCYSMSDWLIDKNIHLLVKDVLNALYLTNIKFNKSDAKAFFNEIGLFNPSLKRQVRFDNDVSFSFDTGKANFYSGYFQSSNDWRDNMDMFLFEIPLKHFYKTPVVFTLGDKKGISAIDFTSIDDANTAFTIYGDKEDIRYLKEKGICEKLLNIGNNDFEDECIWCIHASFYRDTLYIAFDIEYSLSEDFYNEYNKIESYDLFYDNIASIEQYCQQFEDL